VATLQDGGRARGTATLITGWRPDDILKSNGVQIGVGEVSGVITADIDVWAMKKMWL
jgi:hypothetical protein